MLTISIHQIPSSNNRYMGQGSKSKAIRDYQQEKRLWRQYIWIFRNELKASGKLDKLALPLDEATVLLHYHFKGNTRRDPDNYSGKFILDGLKENGIISDDSFKEIDLFPLADFGNDEESVDIHIIPGKRLRQKVSKMISMDLA